MSVFGVYTYTVKPEKLNDQMAFLAEFKAWMKKRPELFKAMKSWNVYSKFAGGKFGDFVELTEFENLAELERNYQAVMGDKEYMTKHYPKIVDLIVPGSFGMEIWNSAP